MVGLAKVTRNPCLSAGSPAISLSWQRHLRLHRRRLARWPREVHEGGLSRRHLHLAFEGDALTVLQPRRLEGVEVLEAGIERRGVKLPFGPLPRYLAVFDPEGGTGLRENDLERCRRGGPRSLLGRGRWRRS